MALNEDLYPSGDITSDLIKNNIKKKTKLISNQNGIGGGLEFAKQTFKLIDKKIKFKLKKKEGSSIKKGDLIAIIEGNIKNILINLPLRSTATTFLPVIKPTFPKAPLTALL